MKLISWNVNGIRSIAQKGFLEWLKKTSPDVVCLQETKAFEEDLDMFLRNPQGYTTYWNSAKKPGYSGVAIFAKEKPEKPKDIIVGTGFSEIDDEGRVLSYIYGNQVLVNAYFPNSSRDHSRLEYKLMFCNKMEDFLEKFRKKKLNIILCGDYNIAHEEIDLRNPKANVKNAGFLPEERKWFSRFLSLGYIDTFRHGCKDPHHYSWWSYRPGVRERNIGWRIDYFCVNHKFIDRVKEAKIHPETMGSDHCPVSLTIKDE